MEKVDPIASDRDVPIRDPFFDNARSLLMVLVVVGHVIRPMVEGGGPMRALYLWIFAFHMPMFVLLSGYFSKRLVTTTNGRARLAVRLLVPYLLFQGVWLAMGKPKKADDLSALSVPYWLMWFLLALFLWRLTLPLYARFRFAIPMTLVASVLAGLSSDLGRTFTLMRLVSFWPFFVIGYRMDAAAFHRLRSPSTRRRAFITLGVLFASMVAWGDHVLLNWTYLNKPYAEMSLDAVSGPLVRVAVLSVAMIAGFAFLSLVPVRATWFSSFGTRTLTVYLLHGFVVRGLQDAGFYRHVDETWEAFALIPLGIAITVALSWRFLDRALSAVTQPMWLVDRTRP